MYNMCNELIQIGAYTTIKDRGQTDHVGVAVGVRGLGCGWVRVKAGIGVG